MDDKKEILKYPPKNSYSLEGMEFLRLHDHGQALIVRTKYSGVFDEHNYDFLIEDEILIYYYHRRRRNVNVIILLHPPPPQCNNNNNPLLLL